MQSTKNRPFFVSLLPFVQDIDRFAVSAHCYATHASSGIHVTHVHKFSLARTTLLINTIGSHIVIQSWLTGKET